MRPVVYIIAAAALTGCSSTLHLKPARGEWITVHFAEVENKLAGRGFVNVFLDDLDCFGFSVAGGTEVGTNVVTKQLPVEGRKFFTFGPNYLRAYGASSAKSCMMHYTFPIEVGSTYQLLVGNDAVTCKAAVVKVEGTRAVPVPLIVRENAEPFADSQGPWCKADARFAGSSSLVQPRALQGGQSKQ